MFLWGHICARTNSIHDYGTDSHLQPKCELQRSFPPGMVHQWVHHHCVLATPQQMLLHKSQTMSQQQLVSEIEYQNTPILKVTFRVAGVTVALHWELATHLHFKNRLSSEMSTKLTRGKNSWGVALPLQTHLMLRCWHAAWCSSTSPILITWFKKCTLHSLWQILLPGSFLSKSWRNPSKI